MDGILVINKPSGMTSFDVIARLRKITGQKKFGHAGTLDPMASGVLVILAGKACRLLPYLKETDKSYKASMELGALYDTDDVTGKVLETAPVNHDFDFAEVLENFRGNLHQKVPAASAKKVNGKKLYEYLRNGQEVPEVYTDITVYDIQPVDEEDLSFTVDCSSGTYIRSICRDFGEKTGNLAAMKSLVRTRANGFTLDQAQDLEAGEYTLYPMQSVLDYPIVQADEQMAADVKNGKKVFLHVDADEVLIMDGEDILAIYQREKEGLPRFRCQRGLWS